MFSFIVDRIKSSIVQAFYFQLVHDTEIAEILVHHLTLIQASYIMNTRIQQMPFSLVSLEASAELRIFFYYAYVESSLLRIAPHSSPPRPLPIMMMSYLLILVRFSKYVNGV